ncbi:signal transduction histidine kinase [Halorubrum alkaliphilum]|uniref:histidine kinase n=1 Tax=Halorubrum alkaliphilum TaxID=261290 RepID=A0A8T4GDI9_9EURY|nr:ATP-binding protein [Halorubrum alkaliphilum]MBP1921551.1 signal transduction histidine kinase [Halorubrum alkaliphilum]
MRMTRVRCVGELGLLAAVGLAPLGYHLISLAAMSDPTMIVTGALVPITCSALVVAATVPVARSPLFPSYTLRITGWSVLGAATIGGVALLFVTYGMSDRPPMERPSVVVIGAMSVGSVFGLALGLTDAQQRRAEDQLERANAQLTVLNRVLRHNIRNAMTVIDGRVELLRKRADGGEESAAVVAENVDRLLSVSEHARHIGEVMGSGGSDEPVEAVVNLVDVVDGVIERLQAEHPNTRFDAPVAETCRVRSHPLTEAVISEVIENAVIHNEGDTRRVSVSIRSVGDGVALRVEDDGPGIPDETIETLQRGYETSMRHTNGLGLWLVWWVVDRSDADLAFESIGDGQAVQVGFERVEVTEAVPAASDPPERAPEDDADLL